MKFQYELTQKIKSFIQDALIEEVSIGCSESQVVKIVKKEGNYFLKIAKEGKLTKEYQKLIWLDGKLDVPKIILFESELGNDYMITKEISSMMLCSEYYKNHFLEGLKVIQKAFEKIKQVDISDCPFDVSIKEKLKVAKFNIENHYVTNEQLGLQVKERFKTVDTLFKYLEEHIFEERFVFSFGDLSLPNIFGNHDELVGFVDVGECGIADMWQDVAICEKSIRRNFGEEAVLSNFRYKERC